MTFPCDHKFVDSSQCLKCGWEAPARDALTAASIQQTEQRKTMTTLPTPAELDRLLKLEKAATPGPWKACGCGKCGLVWSLPLDTTVGNQSGQPDQESDTGQLSAVQQSANAELVAALRNEHARLLLAASTAITLEAQMAKVREFFGEHGYVVGQALLSQRDVRLGNGQTGPAKAYDAALHALSELLATLAKETKDG